MKVATWLLLVAAVLLEASTLLGAMSKPSDGGTILLLIGLGALACVVALAAAVLALVALLRAPAHEKKSRVPALVLASAVLVVAPVVATVALLGAAWH